MKTSKNFQAELQALITERKGMVAENEHWIHKGEPPAYRMEDFQKNADALRALKEPECKLLVEQHEKTEACNAGIPVLRCDRCGEIPEKGKKSLSICGLKKNEDAVPCPGVLQVGAL